MNASTGMHDAGVGESGHCYENGYEYGNAGRVLGTGVVRIASTSTDASARVVPSTRMTALMRTSPNTIMRTSARMRASAKLHARLKVDMFKRSAPV